MCAVQHHKQAFNCETKRAFLHSPSLFILHLCFLHATHVRPPREAINRIKRPWPQLPDGSTEARLESPQQSWPGPCLGTTLSEADCVCAFRERTKLNTTQFFLRSSYFLRGRRLTVFLWRALSHTIRLTLTLLMDILFDRMLLDCSDAELLEGGRSASGWAENSGNILRTNVYLPFTACFYSKSCMAKLNRLSGERFCTKSTAQVSFGFAVSVFPATAVSNSHSAQKAKIPLRYLLCKNSLNSCCDISQSVANKPTLLEWLKCFSNRKHER